MTRRMRKAASGRPRRAIALVVVLLAAVAVVLVVALERPGAPRPLGPPVTVEQSAKRDSSPPTHRRRPRHEHARSRDERRTPQRTTGADDRSPAPAPQASPPPSSGAQPVRSPSVPAAGDDDERDAPDDDAVDDDEPDADDG